ncbi:hypothetical protein DXN04_29330 [Chitinophaga silvisoli]|uniref:Uncharacterized protein n=1 Tax=Chitinophaga silvisoli TaxID=2291814 RepID=A0A3E1NTH2_9BACT|nr:hypothetical protein DXN04_29330 [Chitinophaga silvisoli]
MVQQKLKAAFLKLHADLIQAEERHRRRTVEDSEDLFVDLILLAHYVKEEISDRIANNDWDTINLTVLIAPYGKMPIAMAVRFTLLRIYKIAKDIGVHAEIDRILSIKSL